MVCFCDKMIRCFGGFASENNKAATVEESVAALLPIQQRQPDATYNIRRGGRKTIAYCMYFTILR